MWITQSVTYGAFKFEHAHYLHVMYTGQALSPCPVYRTSNISMSCIHDKQYLPVTYTGQALSPCTVYTTSNKGYE